MKKEVLCLEHLTLQGMQYDVNDVSLILREGECIVITGHSHSGMHELCEFVGHKERIKAGKVFYLDNVGHYPVDITLSQMLFCVRRNAIWKRTGSVKAMEVMAEHLFAHYGQDFKPSQKLQSLSKAEQRIFMLLWAADQGARLIVLYEAQMSLTVTETASLIRVISQMKEEGLAFLIGSGRAEAYFSVADEVAVMRKGTIIKKLLERSQYYICERLLDTGNDETDHMAREKSGAATKEPLLTYGCLTGGGEAAFELSLCRGEIVLIATQESVTQEILWRELCLEEGNAGLYSDGLYLAHCGGAELIKHRIVKWESGNYAEQLAQNLTYGDNLLLPSMSRIGKYGFYRTNAARILNDDNFFGGHMDAASDAPSTPGESLELLLRRWLFFRPRLLLMKDFFSGSDAESAKMLKHYLNKMCERGTTIMLLESDPRECIAWCDRRITFDDISAEPGDNINDLKGCL